MTLSKVSEQIIEDKEKKGQGVIIISDPKENFESAFFDKHKQREELTFTRKVLRKIRGKLVFVDVITKYIKENGKLIRISDFSDWFSGREPKGNVRSKRSHGASEPVEIPELPNNKAKTFVQRFANISFSKLRRNRRNRRK